MKVSKFIGILFEIQETSHLAHLHTTSYAKHMALNELYTDIVDIRDSFIEGWQGRKGEIIKGYKIAVQPEGMDMVKYLRKHALAFQQYKDSLTDGFLKQLIDDLNFLIYATIYKLSFLK